MLATRILRERLSPRQQMYREERWIVALRRQSRWFQLLRDLGSKQVSR